MDDLTSHDERLPYCDCHACALFERNRLRAELETERMRLVACSVIALANTPESAASARDMHPDYQSPYCDDVARAIDREIALRAELAACKQDAKHRITRLRDALANLHGNCYVADAPTEMIAAEEALAAEALDAARKGEGSDGQ